MAFPIKKTEAFDVSAAIQTEIRRGATDPYAIAKKLAPMLPLDVARELALDGLKRKAQMLMSDNRRGSFMVTTKDGRNNVTAFDNDRWTNGRVWVPDNGYVKYRDLTASDCLAIAKDREVRANGHLDEAKRFKALAAAMKRHGVKTAGELSEQVRAEVLK